jgi:hypothetical protein
MRRKHLTSSFIPSELSHIYDCLLSSDTDSFVCCALSLLCPLLPKGTSRPGLGLHIPAPSYLQTPQSRDSRQTFDFCIRGPPSMDRRACHESPHFSYLHAGARLRTTQFLSLPSLSNCPNQIPQSFKPKSHNSPPLPILNNPKLHLQPETAPLTPHRNLPLLHRILQVPFPNHETPLISTPTPPEPNLLPVSLLKPL